MDERVDANLGTDSRQQVTAIEPVVSGQSIQHGALVELCACTQTYADELLAGHELRHLSLISQRRHKACRSGMGRDADDQVTASVREHEPV